MLSKCGTEGGERKTARSRKKKSHGTVRPRCQAATLHTVLKSRCCETELHDEVHQRIMRREENLFASECQIVLEQLLYTTRRALECRRLQLKNETRINYDKYAFTITMEMSQTIEFTEKISSLSQKPNKALRNQFSNENSPAQVFPVNHKCFKLNFTFFDHKGYSLSDVLK